MVEWHKVRRPLAGQVRDLIWFMLKEEGFQAGDRLPSEMELVSRFGVSRGALREALKILEEERVILCQHGIGRFVAPDPSGILQEDITHLKSVSEFASGMGIKLTCKVLSARLRPAEEPICRFLNLSADTLIVVVERAWHGPDGPIIYSIDHFPRSFIDEDPRPEMFAGSLLAIIERSGQRRLEYSKTTIRAMHLDCELSERLQVPCDTPWILLEQVNYDGRSTPILYSRDYYCTDKFQFHVLRRRR